ncbi:MAG: HlyD family efflux transporter periplasmic adaptor subunit [Bythopirellula sp.]|nr:HlyD family efflux transporter periplasmic adaptor subunit [Bythopirellula sp.]
MAEPGYTEKVMSTLDDDLDERHDTLSASWRQVEDFLSSLHELARAPIEPSDFYRQLLEGCAKTLAATGGAVWQPDLHGKWQVLDAINLNALVASDVASRTAHQRLLQQASLAEHPRVLLPGHNNPTEAAIVIGAVHGNDPARPYALVELFLHTGCSPDVQHGWEQFLAAVIHVAEEFHLRYELRTLRGEQMGHADVLALLRRIHRGATLQEVAYDLANEGSRFLGVDRLSVLLRRGKDWQLLAASGTERLEPRADAVKELQSLAAVTAQWGEPLDYVDGNAADGNDKTELPCAVAETLQQHIDHSHARRLIAVPLVFHHDYGTTAQKSHDVIAVLIAENFSSGGSLTRQRVVELAQLCEPALQQAAEWNRWPIRTVAHWTKSATRLWEKWGVSRFALAGALVATALLTLMFVPTDFEIEAPATLMPRIVQDVFATTNGTVREIKVEHGEQVDAGAVLAVLDDAELDLETERVRGELATVRKRLEAIAVARTDRQAREEPTPDRLPLSAEAKQLELRQASLLKQAEILDKRREALTLRSPITGTVLTLDVQNLLRTRPVERGQVLFTVADTHSGWKLETLVPQDRIGHVIAAEQQSDDPLPVRFRLAGDMEHTFRGHVAEITETAVLDTAKLAEELPEVRVEVSVDEESLPAARPQMAATVRVNCGRRSLGYVWLHDAWDNIYSWLAF